MTRRKRWTRYFSDDHARPVGRVPARVWPLHAFGGLWLQTLRVQRSRQRQTHLRHIDGPPFTSCTAYRHAGTNQLKPTYGGADCTVHVERSTMLELF